MSAIGATFDWLSLDEKRRANSRLEKPQKIIDRQASLVQNRRQSCLRQITGMVGHGHPRPRDRVEKLIMAPTHPYNIETGALERRQDLLWFECWQPTHTAVAIWALSCSKIGAAPFSVRSVWARRSKRGATCGASLSGTSSPSSMRTSI